MFLLFCHFLVSPLSFVYVSGRLRPRFVRLVFFLMIRRPPRSTLDRSSAASDVYKRQALARRDAICVPRRGLREVRLQGGIALHGVCSLAGLTAAGALTGTGALIGRNRPSQSTRRACVLHPVTSPAMTAESASATVALILGMAITRTSVCSGADASRGPCGRR